MLINMLLDNRAEKLTLLIGVFMVRMLIFPVTYFAKKSREE